MGKHDETTGCRAEGGASLLLELHNEGRRRLGHGETRRQQTTGLGFTTVSCFEPPSRRAPHGEAFAQDSSRAVCLDDEARFDCISLARDTLAESPRAEERLFCVPDPKETEATLKIPSVDRALDGSSAGLQRMLCTPPRGRGPSLPAGERVRPAFAEPSRRRGVCRRCNRPFE